MSFPPCAAFSSPARASKASCQLTRAAPPERLKQGTALAPLPYRRFLLRRDRASRLDAWVRHHGFFAVERSGRSSPRFSCSARPPVLPRKTEPALSCYACEITHYVIFSAP